MAALEGEVSGLQGVIRNRERILITVRAVVFDLFELGRFHILVMHVGILDCIGELVNAEGFITLELRVLLQSRVVDCHEYLLVAELGEAASLREQGALALVHLVGALAPSLFRR